MLVHNLPFCPHVPAAFIEKHVSGRFLHFRFFQHVPISKDQMDVIVCHGLVVMEGSRALYSVFFPELLREQLEQKLRIMGAQAFRKRDDQLSGFDASSVFLMALPEIILRLIGKILPEFRLHRAVEGIQVLLPLWVADIIYAAFNVGEFADLHKRMPGHVFTFSRLRAPGGRKAPLP